MATVFGLQGYAMALSFVQKTRIGLGSDREREHSMTGKPKDPNRAAATNGPSQGLGPSSSLDVLVVEENPVNRKVVVALLTKWRHRVVVACDGALGLKQLERREFDLVLMDIQMPVLDGYAATQQVREREARLRLPRVPIVALTANAFDEDTHQSLAAGMDAHLAKPYTREQLRELLQQWL